MSPRKMFRRYTRRDAVETAIIDTLEACGWSVEYLSIVGGPDLVIGRQGQTHLVEAKSGKNALKPHQSAWHRTWNGAPVIVLRSAEEAAHLSIQQSQALAGQAAEQKFRKRQKVQPKA